MSSPAATTCHTCGTPLDAARGYGRCGACVFAGAITVDKELEFGGHELLGEIARGGMGVVYRARQHEPQREVALKTLRGASLDSPEALARFRTEAEVMVSLEHPAILPVYQFGEQDGIPFFTMKMARGGTLAAQISGYAGQWRRIAELIAGVADAVQHAHGRGVLHRDLKPANILFDAEGRMYVSDFGIARVLTADASLTLTATVMGTPHYLAPEIAVNDARAATTASDVWSLGVMLYELLAQRRPFEAASIPALMRKIAETEPAVLADVPHDLGVITMKTLAKDPARRYGSARELAEDLRRWLAGEPILARPVGKMERLRLWAQRKPALAALSLLALALFLSAVAALVWGFQSSRREVANVRAANVTAQKELRQALFDRARSGRNARLAGWRESGLAALHEAAAIRQGEALRDEAIAHLVGFDMTKADGPAIPVVQWPATPSVRLPRAFDVFATLINAEGDSRRSPGDKEKLGGSATSIPVQIALHRMSDDARIALSPVLPGSHQRGLRYDPAGRWLVVREINGSNSGIQLLDAQTLQTRAYFPGHDPAGFNDDGSRLALIERGKRMRVLDTAGLSDVGLMPAGRLVPTRAALGTNPAEPLLAVAGTQAGRHAIEVWDWKDGRVVLGFPSNETVHHLAGAGDWLAAGTEYGNISLHNHRQNRTMTLAAHTSVIWHLVFSSDGLLLASSSYDGSTVLWQTDSAQMLVRSTTQSLVDFAADGRRFIEGSDRGYGWGKVDHSEALRIVSDRLIGWGETRLDFSPDGRWLSATWLNTTALFETTTGRLLARLPLNNGQIALFTADGRHLLLIEAGVRSIALAPLTVRNGWLEISRGRDLTPAGAKLFGHASLSANRRWLAFGDHARVCRVMDCRDFVVCQEFKAVALPSVCYLSPDGGWLAAGCFNQNDGLRVWSRENPAESRLLHTGNADPLFSPDGRWLVEGSAREGLFFYDTATWQVIHREDALNPNDVPPRMAWSPDSRLLAFGVRHRTIRLLDTSTWRVVAELTSPLDRAIGQIKFSPDGRTLAASRQSGGIELWDLTKLAAELTELGLPWELPPPVPVAETPPEFAGPLKEAELPPLFPNSAAPVAK